MWGGEAGGWGGEEGTFWRKSLPPLPKPHPSASKDVRYGDKGEKAASVKSLFFVWGIWILCGKSPAVFM